MAKSYTKGRNLAGTWTKNTNSSNLSYLDQTANDAYRHLCALKEWDFLQQPRTITTVASQQFYPTPYDCSKVNEISVLVNTITYTPKLSPSPEHWDQLNLSQFTSDIPEWYIVRGKIGGQGGQIGLWPKPASSGNTIQIQQKCRVIDLSIPDNTSITVDNIAALGTTLTLSSAAATAGMSGLWINITPGPAANLGDGIWYLITGVPTTSTLTLATGYGGTALTTAAAAPCTIGQMPILPEEFHDTPWKRAAQSYWEKETDERSEQFKASADKDESDLIKIWSAPGGDYVIDRGEDPQIINPNLVIRL